MIIAAFGNSIMEGKTGISPHESWFSLLQNELGSSHTLINAGVGGNSAREAAARWEKDVLEKNPDLILLELGGNNHDPRPGHEFRRVDDEEFSAILKKLHSSLPEKFPVAKSFPVRSTPVRAIPNCFYPCGSRAMCRKLLPMNSPHSAPLRRKSPKMSIIFRKKQPALHLFRTIQALTIHRQTEIMLFV